MRWVGVACVYVTISGFDSLFPMLKNVSSE